MNITENTLLKFIILSYINVTIYTIVAILFQLITHEEISSTLTTCFFLAWSGEVLSCAVIKVFKLKEGRDE